MKDITERILSIEARDLLLLVEDDLRSDICVLASHELESYFLYEARESIYIGTNVLNILKIRHLPFERIRHQ